MSSSEFSGKLENEVSLGDSLDVQDVHGGGPKLFFASLFSRILPDFYTCIENMEDRSS